MLTVKNTSAFPLPGGVEIRYALPAGLAVGNATASIGSVNGGAWILPAEVAGGATHTLNIPVTAGPQTGAFVMEARVVSPSGDSDVVLNATLTVAEAGVAGFDALEPGLPDAPANRRLYTKLVGQSFSVDVLALNPDNSTVSAFSGQLQVALVGNQGSTDALDATRCPLNGTVLVALAAQPVTESRRAFTFPAMTQAHRDVRVRIVDTSVSPARVSCSSDNFAIRPGLIALSSPALFSGSAGPSVTTVTSAGQWFLLEATTSAIGYSGDLQLDDTKLSVPAPEGGVLGVLTPTLSVNAASSKARYTEVGFLALAQGAYRDMQFAAVDAVRGDCYESASNFLVDGRLGCWVGTPPVVLGRFVPNHFNVTVEPACGGFSYARQPFSVYVSAHEVNGAVTKNYHGSYAHEVALTDVQGAAGQLTPNSLPASGFQMGVLAIKTVKFDFTKPKSAPALLTLRATEVGADGVASAGGLEGVMAVRSGRLRLSNAYGSVSAPQPMSIRMQFWSGNSWLPVTDDLCSIFGKAAFEMSPKIATYTLSPEGGAGPWRMSFSEVTQGSAEICPDLSAYPWLAHTCAKVTFGIFSPETQRTIHVWETF